MPKYIEKLESMDTGGMTIVDFVTLKDGKVLCISDEYIGLYKDIDSFFDDESGLINGFWIKDAVSEWEIRYDDSGESEQYGEGRWFISDENGMVLGDASFYTEQEAKEFLDDFLKNGE